MSSYYSAGSPGTFKGIAGREGRTGTYDGLYYTAGAVATRPSGLGDFGSLGAIDPAAYQSFRAGGMTHEQATAAATEAPPKEDWASVIAATIGATSQIIQATQIAKAEKQAAHELARQQEAARQAQLAAARGNAMILSSVTPGTMRRAAPPGQLAKLALPIGVGVALLAGVFLFGKKR